VQCILCLRDYYNSEICSIAWDFRVQAPPRKPRKTKSAGGREAARSTD
jgi:hypothetical protein